MQTYTPEILRKDLFDLLRKVATEDKKIEIPLNQLSDSKKMLF